MSYTVKRVFHPVGQGAFFTEQFFRDNSDQACFSVVYDCGTASYQRDLQREIKDAYASQKNKVIDLLFISHFDNDHVSGLRYLLKNGYMQAGKTKIVLPFMHLAWQFISCDIGAMVRALGNLRNAGYTFIFVDMTTAQERGERPPLNVNGEGEIEYPPTVNRENIHVPSGTPIIFESFWQYTLFSIYGNEENAIIAQFETEMKKMGISNISLDDGVSLFEKYEEKKKQERENKITLPQTDWEKLKEAYETVGKKIGRKRTSLINVNSLIILSNGINRKVDKAEIGYKNIFCDYFPLYLHDKKLSCEELTSCLYTGDTDFSDEVRYKELMLRVQRTLTLIGTKKPLPTIMLFQIPHHGSIYCYNAKARLPTNDGRIRMGFVNFDTTKGIFRTRILFDFCIKGKPLLMVTEKERSAIESNYTLSK